MIHLQKIDQDEFAKILSKNEGMILSINVCKADKDWGCIVQSIMRMRVKPTIVAHNYLRWVWYSRRRAHQVIGVS